MLKIKILSIMIPIITLSIIVIKPFYIVVFFIMFSAEPLFFIHDVFFLLKNKKKYCRIEIEEINISSSSIILIWLEYCRISAFLKLYTLLSKKRKISASSLLKTFFIIIFSIPYRFLNVTFVVFYKNKEDFKSGIAYLYYSFFYLAKDKKIEVINEEIFLNCYTIGKLFKKIDISRMSEEQIINFIIDLKTITREFQFYEKSNSELVKLVKSITYGKNDKIIQAGHYTYCEKYNTIHATSNIQNFLLLNNQKIDIPLRSLIKPGADNPGTIVTRENAKIRFDHNTFKWIPQYELNYIKYNNLELFNLPYERWSYIDNQHKILVEVLEKNNISLSEDAKLLIDELSAGLYTENLLSSKSNDFLKEIQDTKNL